MSFLCREPRTSIIEYIKIMIILGKRSYVLRKLTYSFLLALLCLSCTPRESVPTRTISGQVVFEDVDAMMLLSATDSSVLVLNPSDTLLLGIYSPSGHQKFLRKGRGKYEVLNPSLSYCVHGHTLDFIDHAGFASSQPERLFSLDLSCPEDFSSLRQHWP